MNKKTLIEENSVSILSANGYSAVLMKAERLKSDNDRTFGLPPGKPMSAIPIHCLPGAPENWIRDSGTYVVEVDSESGLWFDWRKNDQYNTAVVPTVKGMNPITGMKTEDVSMQQFRDECPIHKIKFAHDLHCEKCGYKWPAQNYVSWKNILWWDGFRQSDGSVRQFFFSEEDKRDIASAIIGKKNTVPAFGFAFYRCTNSRRPELTKVKRISDDIMLGDSFILNNDYPVGDVKDFIAEEHIGDVIINTNTTCDSYSIKGGLPINYTCFNKNKIGGSGGTVYKSCSSSSGSSNASSSSSSKSSKRSTAGGCSCGSGSSSFFGLIKPKNYTGQPRGLTSSEPERPRGIEVPDSDEIKKFDESKEKVKERFNKDVSVGAGAKIKQELELDTTPLTEWGTMPEAVITLYFVFSEQLEAIIEKGGIKPLENKPEAYLQGVPVG